MQLAISSLKKEGVEGIILNGDFSGEKSGINTEIYLRCLLQLMGESEIEIYIVPGSHERVWEVEPLVGIYSQKYQNLIYTIEYPIIFKGDHYLIFLPGADWKPRRALEEGYSLEDSKYKTGLYQTKNGKIKRITNMRDLEKYTENLDSEKIVLFSHIPRRFNDLIAVDMAEFGEAEEGFYWKGEKVEKGGIFPTDIAERLLKLRCPIKIKRGKQRK